jgi:hypothetical protein
MKSSSLQSDYVLPLSGCCSLSGALKEKATISAQSHNVITTNMVRPDRRKRQLTGDKLEALFNNKLGRLAEWTSCALLYTHGRI